MSTTETDAAREIARDVLERWRATGESREMLPRMLADLLEPAIAAALTAAERRGMERAAERITAVMEASTDPGLRLVLLAVAQDIRTLAQGGDGNV